MREEQLARASGYGGFNGAQSLGLFLELSFLMPSSFPLSFYDSVICLYSSNYNV